MYTCQGWYIMGSARASTPCIQDPSVLWLEIIFVGVWVSGAVPTYLLSLPPSPLLFVQSLTELPISSHQQAPLLHHQPTTDNCLPSPSAYPSPHPFVQGLAELPISSHQQAMMMVEYGANQRA